MERPAPGRAIDRTRNLRFRQENRIKLMLANAKGLAKAQEAAVHA